MKTILNRFSVQGILVIALCLSIISCSDAFDTSYFDKEINDPTIAVGLKVGHSTYTAKELFEEISEDLEVQASSDGTNLVSFIYRDEIKGEKNENIVEVENQTLSNSVKLKLSGLGDTYIGPTNTFSEETFTPELKLTNSKEAELTLVDFSNGKIKFDFTNTIGGAIDAELTINSLTKDGIAYKSTITSITTTNSSVSDDITGYSLNLKNGTDQFNTLNITLKTALTVKNGDNINTNGKLFYNIIFVDSKIQKAEGDFKQTDFTVNSQQFDIDFFDNIGNGGIKVVNPTLKLKAKNQYGFPVGFGLEGISAVYKDKPKSNIIIDEDKVKPEHNILKSTDTKLVGNYGIAKAATSNETTTDIILNGENSNLAELFNDKPTQFNLDVTAISNPNSPTDNNNFFNTENRLDMNVEVELPLHVSFENLSFDPEPFEIDTKDIEDIEDDVQSLELIFFTRNSIPLDGTVTLEFIKIEGEGDNQTEQVLFSPILTNKEGKPAIEAAPVNNQQTSTRSFDVIDGKTVLKEGNTIIAPTKTTLTLIQTEIKLLKQATHIKAVLNFDSTKGSDAVKIQITDQVRFDIAFTGDITVSLEEDEEDEENNNNN